MRSGRCMRPGGLLQTKKGWILFARPVMGQPCKIAHQICKAHTRVAAVTSPDPRLMERLDVRCRTCHKSPYLMHPVLQELFQTKDLST